MAETTGTLEAGKLDADRLNQEQLSKELGLTKPEEAAPAAVVDPALEQKADEVVKALTGIKSGDLDAREKSKNSVESFGLQLQKEAALQSEKLKDPVKKMGERSEEGSAVGNALVNLRIQVESLDPMRFDFEPGWITRMMGYIPGVGTPMKRYFSRYESAQTVLNAVIQSLEGGREQLKRDNITLIADQKKLRESCEKLTRGVQLAQIIDRKLQHQLDNELPQGDPQYKFVAEELLFPLRQRIVDLQQQLTVSQQGILAMEVIIRNNKELIRGVNRALSVTINALRVAVTVALALADQKIVLEKVEALSATTTDLIAATAKRLKEEGAAIHNQASSTQLDIEVLKTAFADVRAAMEEIAVFRQKALPQMARSIMEMDTLITEGAAAILQKEKAVRAEPIIPIEIE